jgi:hypothetical protein
MVSNSSVFFLDPNLVNQSSAHTEKVRNATRGCRLWDVKNSGYKDSSPTEVKRTCIHQNLSIFITIFFWNFRHTKSSPQNQRTYISVLELFNIKLMFISFSLCCNHFTSLAYEIFYARKVDLFDKIKEVVFPNLFRGCVRFDLWWNFLNKTQVWILFSRNLYRRYP